MPAALWQGRNAAEKLQAFHLSVARFGWVWCLRSSAARPRFRDLTSRTESRDGTEWLGFLVSSRRHARASVSRLF